MKRNSLSAAVGAVNALLSGSLATRFFLFLALVAIVAPALLLANPQDTVWVKQTDLSSITRMFFSPNSKYIAVGDMNASIFDVLNGQEVHSYPVQCDRGCIKWSKSGKYLLFGSKDAGEYDVVDTINWQIMTKIKVQHERACITSDEKYIITADSPIWPEYNPGIFQVWDLGTGNLIKTIDESNCPDLKSIARIMDLESSIIPDEVYWISYNSGLIKLNITTNKTELIFQNATSGYNFSISPDGSLAAFEPISSSEYEFGVIDLNTKQIIFKIPGEKPFSILGGISGSSISSDNKYLAISQQLLNKCEIWDITRNKLLYTYHTVPCCYAMVGASISNDLNYFVSSSSYVFLYMLRTSSGVPDNTIDENSLIYPNPTTGRVRLMIDCTEPLVQYEIYNACGEKMTAIQQAIRDNDGISIDMANYAAGAYIIKVYCNSYISTYKIIKEG